MMLKLPTSLNVISYALATLLFGALSLNSAKAASLNLENLLTEFVSSKDLTESGRKVPLNMIISNSTPKVRDIVTYTLSIINNGPDAASGINIKNIVPQVYSHVGIINNSGTFRSRAVAWSAVNVSASAIIKLTFQVEVKASTNTANEYLKIEKITASDQLDLNSSYNSRPLRINPQFADLALSITVSNRNPNVEDTVTYTLSITNNEQHPAVEISIENRVPFGYTDITNASDILSSSNLIWSRLSLNNSGTWNIGLNSSNDWCAFIDFTTKHHSIDAKTIEEIKNEILANRIIRVSESHKLSIFNTSPEITSIKGHGLCALNSTPLTGNSYLVKNNNIIKFHSGSSSQYKFIEAQDYHRQVFNPII